MQIKSQNKRACISSQTLDFTWQHTLVDIRTKYPKEFLKIHEQAKELEFTKTHD